MNFATGQLGVPIRGGDLAGQARQGDQISVGYAATLDGAAVTGAQLRAWRYQHGISQTHLAAALQVSVLTVKRWESGYQVAPGFLDLALERLAQKLGRKQKAS